MANKIFNVRLPDEVRERLKSFAAERDETMVDVTIRALRREMKMDRRPAAPPQAQPDEAEAMLA